jgi:hypothetical protein
VRLIDQNIENGRCEWSVAIVSARETIATLAASIDAAARASSGVPTQIDVIVNGNQRLACEAADHARSLAGATSDHTLRVWSIRTGDKANALNQYVHEIFLGSEIAFFVDGYAQVGPDAFRLMAAGLTACPEALAISGVPSVGRNAKTLAQQLIRAGGGHGTLNALPGSVCLRLREINFHLPLGLYRVDGLLFAVLAFNLDPARNSWDLSRLLIEPLATWSFRPLSFWQWSDMRAYVKRRLRQSQGVLESRAFRQHLAIERKPVADLPQSASQLVNSWLAESAPRAFSTFLRNPLCLVGAHQLRKARDWSPPSLRPELLAQVAFNSFEQPSTTAASASNSCRE